MSDKQLVYICGSGHSGSTLLGMVLGNHSQVSHLGEAHVLYISANRTTQPNLCTCGKHVLECEFWARTGEETARLLGRTEPDILRHLITTDPAYITWEDDPGGTTLLDPVPRRLFNPTINRALMVLGSPLAWRLAAWFSRDVRNHRRAITNSLAIFEGVRRAWNTPTIIDSTKNPARLKGLYLMAREKFKVLYLVRDGRAVVNSRVKRQGVDVSHAARIWKSEHSKLKLVMQTLPDDLVLSIRYEDFCRNPERELRRICDHLSIEYEPQMIAFREGPVHNLAGNAMRWRAPDKLVRLDEKWRTEMTQSDLEAFDAVAGALNRSFGYAE